MKPVDTTASDAADLPKLWRELADAGLITGIPTRLGGGNQDRHAARARSSWRARFADGQEAKLTIGADVDHAARTDAFEAAVPGLLPRVLFHRQCGEAHVVAEEWIDGTSLDVLLQLDPARARAAMPALRDAIERLHQTTVRSTDASRESEWLAWTGRLLALSIWDDAGRAFLQDLVLPLLRGALFTAPAEQRWVHGDLIGRNVLVGDHGAVRLIDAEFAELTHFPQSELARLYALTPGLAHFAKQLLPDASLPSPAAELQFWLRQIEREATLNSPEYVARWLPQRQAEVGRLASELAGGTLERIPWTSAQGTPAAGAAHGVDYAVEEARWLIDRPRHALRIAGWCCPSTDAGQLVAVAARIGTRHVAIAAMQPRPDVQAHFRGRLNALSSGFELLLPPIEPDDRIELIAQTDGGDEHRFWSEIAGQLPGRGPVLCEYPSWAALLDPDTPGITAPAAPVRFSVVVPVHNPPTSFLQACLDSVRRQTFGGWELHLVDDASTDPAVRALLEQYASLEPRIRASFREVNGGIARATNDGLHSATGDFVVFLDHDDVLRPNALAVLAQRLQAEPGLDVVYSDEDKIDPEGRRSIPLFKPAFSPEYLRGVMYVGHVLCVRRTVALAAGGFDSAFDGVQDYEFMLRVSEQTRQIGHIPRVLYHWRQSAGSSALIGNVKGDMDARQRRAVEAHLKRIGDPRIAGALGGHRVGLRAADAALAAEPSVDNRQLMVDGQRIAECRLPNADCETGHHKGTETQRGTEDGRETADCRLPNANSPTPARRALRGTAVVRWAQGREPLEQLRDAARGSSAEVLILLSQELGALPAKDVAELAALAGRPDSGCVAPVLVSRGGLVAESGCIIAGETLVPVMRGFDPAGDGYNGSLRCNREVDAVSPWCVAIRRELAIAHATPGSSWIAFLRRCRNAGLFHRVCASVRVATPLAQGAVGQSVDGGGNADCRLPIADAQTQSRKALNAKSEAGRAEGEAVSAVDGQKIADCRLPIADCRTDQSGTSAVGKSVDGGRSTVGGDAGAGAEQGAGDSAREFYNPHFRAEPADYRLARQPSHLERGQCPFVFQLETTLDEASRDGWLELRGWCFHLGGTPVKLRLRCGGLDWLIAVAEPRPDVATVHPLFTNGACGFAQRIGLPAGFHELVLEAQTSGESHVVFQRQIRVARMVHWHRWRASPARRLAFQLSASPAHAPVPLQRERWPTRRSAAPRPRLSVVTPSYQQARFLPQTLASVLDQGIPCEYVVQDGGSTDGSRELLQAHDGRLTAWSSEPDSGQAAAIAKGFARTSGAPDDLMAWINSDDFYLPGALGYVTDLFADHPEIDVVYGHRVLVDEAGREIGRWFLPPHDEAVLELNDFVPQETLFWRRRLWDRVGGIDPELKFAMDWDLLLRFQAAGAKILRVPYFLACFRVHAAQKTSAQLSSVGQREIDTLRQRTFGRALAPAEIESDPRLARYLKRSAWIEWLWRSWGVRAR